MVLEAEKTQVNEFRPVRERGFKMLFEAGEGKDDWEDEPILRDGGHLWRRPVKRWEFGGVKCSDNGRWLVLNEGVL